MNAFWMVLEQEIGAATGQPFALRQREPVGGGCIHQAWRVTDRDRSYSVKVNAAARLPLFEAEAAGLAELAATATSRPCLVAVVKRSYYQRIRIVRR